MKAYVIYMKKNQSILVHVVNQKFTAKYVSNVAYCVGNSDVHGFLQPISETIHV